MALPPALKEKMKEKEGVREGEADQKKGKKKPPFMKKGKKDTEIEKGPVGSEGVTKANRSSMSSLDDENNDACGKKMDKKGGKDCGCEHKNDALTPQEYLAACDLGIQDRSRVYIRARLDAGAGTGKKCGNSYIPRNATCNNGQAPRSTGRSSGRRRSSPGSAALTALSVAGSVQQAASAVGNLKNGKIATGLAQVNGAVGYARGAQSFSQGKIGQGLKRQVAHAALSTGIAAGVTGAGLAARSPTARRAARAAGAGVGYAYGSTVGRAGRAASNAAFSAEQRMRGFKKMKRPYRSGGLAKRDSPWANGFSVTDAESALTANAMNLATDNYSNEKRKRNAQGQPQNIIYANTFNT